MKKIKFEHMFAIILLIFISIALFIFREDKDLVMVFATSLVGAFASVTTFFFTKYTPENQSFINTNSLLTHNTPTNNELLK